MQHFIGTRCPGLTFLLCNACGGSTHEHEPRCKMVEKRPCTGCGPENHCVNLKNWELWIEDVRRERSVEALNPQGRKRRSGSEILEDTYLATPARIARNSRPGLGVSSRNGSDWTDMIACRHLDAYFGPVHGRGQDHDAQSASPTEST